MVGYEAGCLKPNSKLKDSSHLPIRKLNHDPFEGYKFLNLSQEARSSPWYSFLSKGPLKTRVSPSPK